MVAIIDYDAGNLKSVQNALKKLGSESVITRDPQVLAGADHVILPGVGAFGDAMAQIASLDLVDVIRKVAGSGVPFLGICLGMQLLFEKSEESPGVTGLDLLPGEILRIPDGKDDTGRDLKIPHIGWNSLEFPSACPLFEGLGEDPFVYFVHSYYLRAYDTGIVAATTQYSTCIHAAAWKDNLFGCQFHPEKSGDVGEKILKNFLGLSRS